MEIIQKILQLDLFQSRPPVLIDVGASGNLNAKWKSIAPYSICIAFDADDREFHITEHTNRAYKKLIVFNRVVTSEPIDRVDFYLTRSPFCSSLLCPDSVKLKPWAFSSLFDIQKKVQLPAITLSQALSQVNIDYIDWFKTDTQGTDLSLFKTLPPNLSGGILAAEFEPGVIDAYINEDKLYAVMEYLHRHRYWLSSMEIKGTQRISEEHKNDFSDFSVRKIIKTSPCWAEVTYLRELFAADERQTLLLFIFALLEKQYGFALQLADWGSKKFERAIFLNCKKAVIKKLKTERWKTPLVIFKRQFNKLFSNIND